MVHSKGPSHERGGEVFRLCPSGAPPPNGLSALSERCRYHRCCCLGVAFVEEEEEEDDEESGSHKRVTYNTTGIMAVYVSLQQIKWPLPSQFEWA
mmetsp:Transcript_38199/g.65041  ORF Transcript_38199/g.65041 Transcript_38199/m.65041 type:complete len:95 (-) Transcript_38199:196-480(-)